MIFRHTTGVVVNSNLGEVGGGGGGGGEGNFTLPQLDFP